MSPVAPLAQAPEGFFTARDPEELDCVARGGFCPGWIADNWDRYVDPFFQHVYLTGVAVVIGFAIAFALGLLAHRRRWLNGPLTAFTSILYTIPSIALFLLLLPITGRGNTTALIALVAYTQLIIFRNVTTGLRQVPSEVVDAAEGMGLTPMQTLLRVEVPMALPEILAGLRIAASTTVGLATLAFFAGAGGLGAEIEAQITFKSNVVVAGGLAVALAAALDLAVLVLQKALMPWRRATVTG
ncbi:MAG: ABC transporter permease [Actinomycetota bacterium]|nr:ABC transporter permease [Actinomycetota bacterium]